MDRRVDLHNVKTSNEVYYTTDRYLYNSVKAPKISTLSSSS